MSARDAGSPSGLPQERPEPSAATPVTPEPSERPTAPETAGDEQTAPTLLALAAQAFPDASFDDFGVFKGLVEEWAVKDAVELPVSVLRERLAAGERVERAETRQGKLVVIPGEFGRVWSAPALLAWLRGES